MLAVMEIVFLKLFHISCVALQIVILRFEMLVFSILGNTQKNLLRAMLQGTWCDGLIVQAIANALGITLHIIKSHQNFKYREDNN